MRCIESIDEAMKNMKNCRIEKRKDQEHFKITYVIFNTIYNALT